MEQEVPPELTAVMAEVAAGLRSVAKAVPVLTVQLTKEEKAKDIILKEQEDKALKREVALQKGEDPDKDDKPVFTVQLTKEEQAKDIIQKEKDDKALKREVAEQKGEDPDKEEKEEKTVKGITGAMGLLSTVANGASTAVQGMSAALSTAGGGFTALGSGMGVLGGAISGVTNMFAQALGPVGKAAGEALGQVAQVAGQLVSAVGELLNVAQKWVQLLAPGSIEMFNQALENLQATVGVAWEPVFQIMTEVAQRWAGELLPVMRSFRPIIEQVARAIGGAFLQIVKQSTQMLTVFIPIVKALADLFVTFMSVLSPVLSLMQLLAVLIQPLAVALGFLLKPVADLAAMMQEAALTFAMEMDLIGNVMRAFQETVEALLPRSNDGAKNAFKDLQTAVRETIKSLYVFIGTLAKFFGADTFLKNLVKQLETKTGEVAAGKNASIQGIDSLAKELATAAATASGSAATEQEKSLGDVVEQLKNLQSGGDSKFSVLLNKIDKLIESVKGTANTFSFEEGTPVRRAVDSHPAVRLGRAVRDRLRS